MFTNVTMARVVDLQCSDSKRGYGACVNAYKVRAVHVRKYTCEGNMVTREPTGG